jgi:hypothetical protein
MRKNLFSQGSQRAIHAGQLFDGLIELTFVRNHKRYRTAAKEERQPRHGSGGSRTGGPGSSARQSSFISFITARSLSAAGADIGVNGMRTSAEHFLTSDIACLIGIGLVSMNNARISGSIW